MNTNDETFRLYTIININYKILFISKCWYRHAPPAGYRFFPTDQANSMVNIFEMFFASSVCFLAVLTVKKFNVSFVAIRMATQSAGSKKLL